MCGGDNDIQGTDRKCECPMIYVRHSHLPLVPCRPLISENYIFSPIFTHIFSIRHIIRYAFIQFVFPNPKIVHFHKIFYVNIKDHQCALCQFGCVDLHF